MVPEALSSSTGDRKRSVPLLDEFPRLVDPFETHTSTVPAPNLPWLYPNLSRLRLYTGFPTLVGLRLFVSLRGSNDHHYCYC